ncbi:MAG: ribulokinase [Armatimonadetes bacterium]|nr:ribulokinase [Armatimonadota bacterium]
MSQGYDHRVTSSPSFALGLDFGTGSVRALIVDCHDGSEAGVGACDFPQGEGGVLVSDDPNLARQDPRDWFLGASKAIYAAIASSGVNPTAIVGIGLDATASTPVPVDAGCRPLCFDAKFSDDLAAFAWLWKDHTSHAEAAEITALAMAEGRPYLAKFGGAYSSEWFWSKALHCARTSPVVFDASATWLEETDLIAAHLCGIDVPASVKRSACAAGHKAMFNPQWGGYPDREFLSGLDPRLARLHDSMTGGVFACDVAAGGVSGACAAETGIPKDTPVAVGIIDAHAGAVGSGIVAGTMVKILGTSSCDILVGPSDGSVPDIEGVAGVAHDSVIPGMLGIEAGQAAVGDLFDWYARSCGMRHDDLTEAAAQITPGSSGLLALDWNNGNRNVLADPLLTGLLVGQTLRTTPAQIYRALIESTAFGGLKIIQQIEEVGVPVEQMIVCGGIADKNPLVLQIYADVLGRPIKVSRSQETCALGAAIFGAVVGGAHSNTDLAIKAMTGSPREIYRPVEAAQETYRELYALYIDLHDAFGRPKSAGSLHHVMKRLIEIRQRSRPA